MARSTIWLPMLLAPLLAGCLATHNERIHVRREWETVQEEQRRIRPDAYEEWLKQQRAEAERLALTPALNREGNYWELSDARIEALAPGFRAQILARTITTPRGLQQMNANLIGGDLGGGSNAWHRQLIFRPLFPYFRHRTPVRGLYLSSSYTHPGAGVHGMCGYNAAQQVLADAGRSPRSLPASEEETARR